ncbi:MAG: sigma-54-dependent Fis family transcriptional regulator [Candidatus Cloacimonetes bacterium]|nr:sigma-54-dependent Fis family transcriptional regulator [Candidatus Cloacimonadota bacterium]
MAKIVIVDDNKNMQIILQNLLADEGYEVISATNGKDGLKAIIEKSPDLVLLDIRLPEMNGIDVLQQITKFEKEILVIMITAYGDVETAVETMKLGAYDYITKPFVNEELKIVIRKALDTNELKQEVKVLRQQLEEKKSEDIPMGNSIAIMQILKQVELVASTDMSVIIQGKSGTGKEVIANLIHKKSKRKNKAFIPIDCGAIPDTLVESELFGYQKGAFTGASSAKKGKFEVANGGTLFLDEITNLPPSAQAKILRVIQEKKITKVGGTEPINIDVRIIVATNINIIKAVQEYNFRDDLFHRLNEFTISLPTLKERKDDIPIIAEQFLKEANIELEKSIKGFLPKAMSILESYAWPGNVRELKHVIKKAVLLEETDHITPNFLDLEFGQTQKNPFKESLDKYYEMITSEGSSISDITAIVSAEMERVLIKRILVESKYNKSKAARILGIDRNTLYTKLKCLGIE